MDERRSIQRRLDDIEQEMRKLEIAYDQYFAGVEKREPVKKREQLARKLRQLTGRHIVQTDIRFRVNALSSRFHTYANYWDRILRLMDEGRFIRGSGRIPPPTAKAVATAAADKGNGDDRDQTTEKVYEQLVRACEQTGAKAPSRAQVEALLQKQQEKIREKFGDRAVDFVVETEGGKPKLKVRARK